MSRLDAWVITLLGMGVVFIGLVLCIAFIQVFNRIARRVSFGDGHASQGPASEPAPALPPDLPRGEPVDPDVLAVIAAVLEVERKLYLGRPDARLTIRRPVPQS
jgi:Na+-transporting methylmalonyl-CoA/oxaloacetate decarboxylase gamma subunit